MSITKPIVLGASIDDNTFLLDVNTLLNNSSIINLELQIINEHNWIERSLIYLCRSFDNLARGGDYQQVRPAVQIGLLDFTLFPGHPEFYSTYQFLSVENHMLYSDKLRLSVVGLTKIDIAIDEDKLYHIDCWVLLFKAATWGKVKMPAQKDEYIRNAASIICQLSQDETIRLQCRDWGRRWVKRLSGQMKCIVHSHLQVCHRPDPTSVRDIVGIWQYKLLSKQQGGAGDGFIGHINEPTHLLTNT